VVQTVNEADPVSNEFVKKAGDVDDRGFGLADPP
jgi:hypothetical protein